MGHYLFNFTKKGAAKGRSLREQAGDLLDAKLWGIGAKTPNRDALAPGDQVLIYVGAPESSFIGHAELSSPNHTWTAGEQARYPEKASWNSGVAFSKAELWPHPIPIGTILPSLELKETNPNAHFFAGVARIKQKDFETVVAAAGAPTPTPTPAPTPTPTPALESFVDLDLLFQDG